VASGDPDSTFCSGISRGTTGDINGFNNQLRNLGTIQTQGYDLAITWVGPKKRFGRFSSNWQTTYTENYSSVANDTGLAEPAHVGYEVNDSGIPRWRSTLRFNWALQPLTATYALRYLSALTEACDGAQGFASCDNSSEGPAGTNRLHSVLYSDLQASYTLPIKLKNTISAGVNNVFQAGPPECLSCSLNGYDASNYDLPGRFAYVSAGVKF
jgi:iron complex outermembrane receptor protein